MDCINKEKTEIKHFLPRRFEWLFFLLEIIEEKVEKNFTKNLQLPDVSDKNRIVRYVSWVEVGEWCFTTGLRFFWDSVFLGVKK